MHVLGQTWTDNIAAIGDVVDTTIVVVCKCGTTNKVVLGDLLKRTDPPFLNCTYCHACLWRMSDQLPLQVDLGLPKKQVPVQRLVSVEKNDSVASVFGDPISYYMVECCECQTTHRSDDPNCKSKPEIKPALSILDEAAKLTSTERQATYGHPRDNHARTAALWSTYLDHPITTRDVCMLNILQKISRDMASAKRDNLVDIAGYARNAEMLEEQTNKSRDPVHFYEGSRTEPRGWYFWDETWCKRLGSWETQQEAHAKLLDYQKSLG